MKALILSHALASAYAVDSKDDWTALGRTGAFRHVETPAGGFFACVRSTTGRRPHFLDPTGLIRGLADLGVTHIATTAVCGSLSKWRKTPYILLIDQFLDFHRSIPDLGADQDFFDISVPYCPAIRKALRSRRAGLRLFDRGCYVGVDGPRFETAAEIEAFRRLGGDVIGMTAVPEAVAARAAGLCIGTVAVAANIAAGTSDRRVSNTDIQRIAARTNSVVSGLLSRFIKTELESCSCHAI